MKYLTSIEINLPREKVIELFDSTENLKHWQPGLISFTALSGDAGQEDAKSELVFQMGKRKIVMVETITKRDLPDAFHGTYETKGMYNEVRNYFKEIGPNKTLWESENIFEGSGIMKLFLFLAPRQFKKQSLKYMKNFKAFAEEGKSVLS